MTASRVDSGVYPQAYVQSDLDMFNKNFSTAIVGKSQNLASIDGDENFLLIRSYQHADALCRRRPERPDRLSLQRRIRISCGITEPGNAISTSYGYNEANLSPFYTARQCAEYGPR